VRVDAMLLLSGTVYVCVSYIVTYCVQDLEDDQGLQQAIKTSYGQRPTLPVM